MPCITIDEFVYWLRRSEEARVAAKQLTDLCEKEQMVGIAEIVPEARTLRLGAKLSNSSEKTLNSAPG